MAGRLINVPDEVRRVYAIGHCVPIVGAIAPEKLVNSYRLSDSARRFLPAAYYVGKTVPVGGMCFSDEEVLKMAPDLIVMEAGAAARDQADRLSQRLHIPVVLVDQDMRAYKQAFAFLGELLGHQAQAGILADFVATKLDPIAEKAKNISDDKRMRVYYAEGVDGLSTNPSGSNHVQVLDFVGAINVAQVVNAPGEGMSVISLEQLYLWQPDVVLAWTPSADQLTTWRAIAESPLWQELHAVKKGRLIQIPWLPFSWFDRPPGSNRILGAIWLAQTLYPDVFRFDLPAVTREYFRKFYHYELSAAEADYLLQLAHPAAQTASTKAVR